jgi:hypothetical protein
LNFIGPASSTLKGIPIGSTISLSSLTASISSLLQNPSTLATNVAQLFTTFSLVSTNKTNLYTTTIQTVLSNTTNGSISSSIDVINSISQTISSAQVKEALIQTTTNILINNTTQEIAQSYKLFNLFLINQTFLPL